MMIFIYNFLTQTIILLGKVRGLLLSWDVPNWDKHWNVRKDRTFYANSYEAASCCDCGLTHLFKPLDGEEPRSPHFKAIPIRPKGYRYRFRLGAVTPSEFKDESRVK